MKSMKLKSILSLVLIWAFLPLFVATFRLGVFAVSPTVAEAKAYYNNNKNIVEIIDEGAGFFTKLCDEYADTGNTDAYNSMVSLVNVAKKATDFKTTYVAEKYLVKYRKSVTNELELTLNTIKATTDNYQQYCTKEAGYLERIETAKTKLDSLSTKQASFNEAKATAKTSIVSKQNELVNTDGTPMTVVGSLDSVAKAAVNESAEEYLTMLDAISYTTDVTNDKDDEEYLSAINEIEEVAKSGKDRLSSTPKNDVERTYNDLSDYEAMRDGYISPMEGETSEQFTARKVALKEKVIAAIDELNETFFPNASSEVLKEYSAEKQHFDAFVKSYNAEDTSYADKDTVTSEDEVFSVTAYYQGTDTKVAVFPGRAVIKALNCSSGAAKTNAENAIRKLDNKLGVAYFVLISIYSGPTEWTAVDEDAAGNKVEYVVSVDLEKYYQVYIEGHESLLTMLLKEINFIAKSGANKAENISTCATDYLSTNKTDNNSLCYYYTRSAEGDSVVVPLAYELKEGNILMFKTDAFDLFAVSEVNSGSLFAQPLFYVIMVLALVLLIAIIVIVVKNVRYSVRFVTGDGSKVKTVKARKGESIVMPNAPTKAGYVFAGWYEDKELTRRFLDTEIKSRKSIKVYAKWLTALTQEKIDSYFEKLREALLSHGAYSDADNLNEDETVTLAILASSSTEIKMYLAIDAKAAVDVGYEVKSVTAKEYEKTPTLFVVDSKEKFVKALELVDRLVKENGLVEEPIEIAKEEAVDKHYFVFKLDTSSHDIEQHSKDKTEEIKDIDETSNEVSEAVETHNVEEEKVEEANKESDEESKEVDKAKLDEYYMAIRKAVMGYALVEQNDKVKDGMMLVKAYIKTDGVYVYLAGNPDELGLEKSVGLFVGDTPAFAKVDNDEVFEKVVSAIGTMMTEFGFEKTGEEAELKEVGKNGFGYRLKFNN